MRAPRYGQTLFPIVAALALIVPTVPTAAKADAGEDAFGSLTTLVGSWRIADQPGSTMRIHFYLTAGGSVLAENWERAGVPHSLTLFHRDQQNLMVTHYCPQGNQPRLALSSHVARPSDGPLHFAFVDATDIDGGEAFLFDLAIDLSDPARPLLTETYRQNGEDEITVIPLVRVTE